MSLNPLTENMGMIRMNYSEKNKNEVTGNDEAKLNLIVSEKGGKVSIKYSLMTNMDKIDIVIQSVLFSILCCI